MDAIEAAADNPWRQLRPGPTLGFLVPALQRELGPLRPHQPWPELGDWRYNKQACCGPSRLAVDQAGPLIGKVTLPFQNLHVDAVSGQLLTVFTPQPGTPEADAIRLLASWNADKQTTDQAAGTSRRTPDA